MTKDEMVSKLRKLYLKQIPTDAIATDRYWTDTRFAVRFSHPQWRGDYWLCSSMVGDLAKTMRTFRDAKKWVLNEYRNRDGDSAE